MPWSARGLLEEGWAGEGYTAAQWARLGVFWLAANLFAAVVLGWAFVRLFMSHAHTMTYVVRACGGGLAAPLPRLPVKAAPHHPFHPAPARPPPTTQTNYANVLLPGAAALSLMVLGQTGMSIAMLAVAAIACYLFFRWRDQIALAARLLGVSAHSLAQNPHLVSTTVLLSLAR